ncbi:ral GTPase-activating protein subunit alpha-1-like isoform X3 [Watersipora subatra]|uniref:ral GTPase-activating protein subunit alpha-1-like isoform X3 n=1 Tax=Watersipora subatra TaxID=2589382 RepID=UPI00355BFFF4
MFRSKSHGDIKKLAKKFLDVRKSNTDRFKYLKNVVGIGESEGFATEDVKGFFEQHYQHVYYVFYEMFVYVDQERRVRGQKVHKDDFDALLVLFEQIFVLLPRLVQRRWQFHSIRRLLKQLLHSGNSMKVRKDGVRLYIMWYQILQEQNDTENHEIFSKLVSLYDNSEAYLAFSDVTSVPTVEMPVVPVEIHPLAPAGQSDKHPSKIHKYFMESVLTFMVSEVVKIHWGDTPSQESLMQERAFRFLFASFKTYYLNVIFPNFDNKTSVYSVQIDHLPEFGTESGSPYVHVLEDCQDVVIRWFTTFVQASPDFTPAEISKRMDDHPAVTFYMDETTTSEVSDLEAEGGTLKEGDVSTLENKAATLTNGSVEPTTTAGLDGLTVDNINLSVNQHGIVCKVLLGDRDNINIVHEVFRQAFMLPLTHAGAVRRVVLVYKDWLQVPEKRPTFMQEPSNLQTDEVASLSGKDFTISGGKGMDGNLDLVKAGLQNSLLLFIKHSAFVFMINPSKESLSMQVDLCRRVLNIYRYMVMNITLDTKTWEQLLRVLLKVTAYVLGQDDTLLGKHLAASLFQTLVVSWIKANLCIHMSEDLWDQLLSVLSALCHWEELIKEWAKTMETLTRVLAKQVYKLNLSDLPLDRLSEQKSKRQRGKMPPITRSDSKKGTFSRAYSRFDSATAFRAQLLSRSATQDSESTIIDERDDLDGEFSSTSVSRMHSFTEAIHSIPPQLTRSSSDSNLSSSLDKPKVGSTVTLVSSERDIADTADVNTSLTFKVDNQGEQVVEPTTVDEYDHIPMSISDGTSPVTNHTSHSSSSENSRCSPDDSNLMDDFCLLAQRSKLTNFDGKRTDEIPASNGVVRNSNRLHSETTNSLVSESEMSEETSSVVSLSDCGDSVQGLGVVDSARSHSSSPTSNDLTHYLPDDMASFLKHDSITTSSVIFDSESLKHAPSFDNEGISIEELGQSSKSSQGQRSVLTGGQLPGWTPDVAVVLWKRMLGILGDINDIKKSDVHGKVMEHLLELQETLFKLSDNINVSAENTQSLDPAEINAPVSYFFPVCFKCLSLGQEYQKSKVVALQMLTKICLRHDYTRMPSDILAKFYQLLHRTLISTEQPLVDTLVRFCTPLLFGLDLPGANLFILDVLNAATSVLSLESIRMVPRREAITLLGTLVCAPNHFGSIDVLTQGNSSRIEMEADQLKDMVLAVLLDAGRKEPAGLARCVALSSLGIFLVEEMLSGEKHSKFRDAVNVLLVSLRFNTKLVAWVACDMLILLSDFVPQLTEFEAGLPVKIVSTIAATFHNHVFSQTSLDDNLVISIMFCLLRWCMNLPLADLAKADEQGKCLIGKVLKILQVVSAREDKQNHGTPGLSQEYDLESMMSVAVCTNSPVKSLHRAEAVEHPEYEGDSVSYAARFVMRHLVNLVNHFPANSNPTHTYTSLQECNDLDTSSSCEMNKEVFDSPNLQMFVFNRSTLITVMEMDKRDITCTVESATVSRTTARVLIRDLTGKYSSSSTMVYERQAAPTTHERTFSQSTITDSLFDAADVGTITDAINNPLPSSDDPLDKILRHVGEFSTECQLQPGEPLDKPFDAIDEQTGSLEEEVRSRAAMHEQEELITRSDQKTDFRLQVERMRATQHTPSTFPFTVCRQLLNQLSYLSWETRQNYYLLKKNDKLLRELKHLDSQSCRETHKFAVVYVANGHEDKQSILSNSSASSAFERFVSGLGWEVDLATHEGFMGGLQRNGTNGLTAPYYCTSTLEIMYHVSTRMPATTEEDRHRKLRHIGNDEIHIVWSEHYRPYRRGIIPTEFGDVILIIYPLKCGLFRIQIDKKAEVPYFGPLFDGAIVSERVLPVLVRYTAINASRVHRLTIPHFKPFFQVRIEGLDKVVQDCRQDTTFETYAAGVFAPSLTDPEFIVPHGYEAETEQSQDTDPGESVKNKEDKEDLFGPARLIRRMSGRSRKSSTKHISTPPSSPKAWKQL